MEDNEMIPPASEQDSRQGQLDPQMMADFVNETIYERLQLEVGSTMEVKQAVVVEARNMRKFIDASKLQDNKVAITIAIQTILEIVYDLSEEQNAIVAAAAAQALIEKYESKVARSRVQTREEVEQLKYAFTKIKYVGDAHIKFSEYLWRCFHEYTEGPDDFVAPYVAVAQSSGFGKSRMLQELAIKARDDQILDMKVLYMCMRGLKSTGYPKATPKLCDWLFPKEASDESIANKLKAVFYYAMENWDTVQTEWLGLFTDMTTDGIVTEKLKTFKSCNHKTNQGKRMVVIVFDEARGLFNNSELDNFHKLRHGLCLANKGISTEGGIFGVVVDTNSRIVDLSPPEALDQSSRGDGKTGSKLLFSPFVLTHTMDANWEQYCREKRPRLQDDEEQKESSDAPNIQGETELSMDDEMIAYKRAVRDDSDAWQSLRRMGRPLWYCSPPNDKIRVINFAAAKLMLGEDPDLETSYTADTMFGVAAMLCRLGVRPYLTSTLSSRVVADFMAILAYVNYERDGFLSNYDSDPVLTFGATKVWHAIDGALAKYMLPQLSKLILSETLDTGGIGEMVARIVMLLAMDKCVETDSNGHLHKGSIGEFVPLTKFLKVLGVKDMPIINKGDSKPANDETKAFAEWLTKWEGWYVGYTHFVPLIGEPNEETLWFLLGRRAAGVFPPNQHGADLLIPIFKKGTREVSLIPIQVKNRFPDDSAFSRAVTAKFTCPFILKVAGNRLGSRDVDDVIWIDLSEREIPQSEHRFKFIYASTLVDNFPPNKTRASTVTSSPTSTDEAVTAKSGKGKSTKKTVNTEVKDVAVLEKKLYTVCFRSLTPKAFPFLDEEVAKSLTRIVKSSWSAEALVDGDLEQRDRAETGKLSRLSRAMPKDEQLRIMMKGMKVMKTPVAKAPEKETTATKRRATADASASVKQTKNRRCN